MREVTIENGFALVGAGGWLMGRSQPAAYAPPLRRLRRGGWMVRDRSRLSHVDVSGHAYCGESTRPFLTHIPCAAQISAVSSKVLVAPAEARTGDFSLKLVPMSAMATICVTEFSREWVVMATAGRVKRVALEDGQTLTVRPEAAVAWTGNRPTGFCPRLGLFDLILPRGPKNLLLDFHGPSIVWFEGVRDGAQRFRAAERRMW